MEELIEAFKKMLNIDLPAKYTSPVRFNHCFNRIILDWLFSDCWYNHLSRKQTAISQLNKEQLQSAIERMNKWLENQNLLIGDNNSSLQYRKKALKDLPALTAPRQSGLSVIVIQRMNSVRLVRLNYCFTDKNRFI